MVSLVWRTLPVKFLLLSGCERPARAEEEEGAGLEEEEATGFSLITLYPTTGQLKVLQGSKDHNLFNCKVLFEYGYGKRWLYPNHIFGKWTPPTSITAPNVFIDLDDSG